MLYHSVPNSRLLISKLLLYPNNINVRLYAIATVIKSVFLIFIPGILADLISPKLPPITQPNKNHAPTGLLMPINLNKDDMKSMVIIIQEPKCAIIAMNIQDINRQARQTRAQIINNFQYFFCHSYIFF